MSTTLKVKLSLERLFKIMHLMTYEPNEIICACVSSQQILVLEILKMLFYNEI